LLFEGNNSIIPEFLQISTTTFSFFYYLYPKLNNMNRLNFIFGLAAMAFLAACQPSENKIRIGYVQITQDPVLDAAKAGVFRALADSGFIDGQNIKVLDNNAQGDLSMINMILQSLLSQNVDLVITNSTPCMVAAAQTVRNTPVVFTVAFSPEQVGMKTTPENLQGVYDPLKTVDFVDLILECIPGLKRIGIPFNNAEPNAEYSAKVLGKEFSKRGITLVTASVTSSNDILQAGQYLVGQQIDALVVSADNTVYLGLPILAKLAAGQKIPLFVTEPMQAEKGACIGFGANFDQWGYQAGLKAVEILKGRTSSANRIEPIINYDLIINRKACAEQGLLIPEKVTGRATRIIN
jgi:putative ABC transport system substrate-binding protein